METYVECRGVCSVVLCRLVMEPRCGPEICDKSVFVDSDL